MKSLLFIFIMFLILGCDSKHENISEKNRNHDWKEGNLSGEVKCIKEEQIFVERPKANNITYTYFNIYGLITEWNSSNESEKNRTTYQYDDEGNIIKVKNVGEYNNVTKIKYDKKGRIILSEDETSKSIYKWDEKENESEISHYNSNNIIEYKMITIFDNKNNPVEFKTIYPDGNLRLRAVMKYNDKGKMTEKTYFDQNGIFRNSTIWKYDEKGNIIEENEFGKDKKIIKTTKFEYKYNDTGNWIEKIESIQRGKIKISKRNYEYYNKKENSN